MDAQESTPGVYAESAIDDGLKLLSEIDFFTYQEGVTHEWLEQQVTALIEGVGLPTTPIYFIQSIEEANTFAEKADNNTEWVEKWTKLRDTAINASGVNGGANALKAPWYTSREKAMDATERAREFGQVGRDAQKRCASWIQYMTVEEQLKKPNPLAPFVNVYAKGSAIIGIADGKVGVLSLPTPKK